MTAPAGPGRADAIDGGRHPRRGLPARTQTIRFRLTVTYSVLLFGLAALLVGGVYLAVASSVDAAPLDPLTVNTVEIRDGRVLPLPGGQFQAADLASVQQAVNYQTLETLRTYSLIGLAVLFVASLVIGWWLSGRALAPVRRITAAARDISATDLSRRIALDGPDDELRALADTVDGMLERLDRAFTAQRQLIDDASHELRNPLAVIQANLDAVLSRDDVTPRERSQASAVVARATSRMTRLVEDLLASARRAAPALTETDVDLDRVADEAAEEYALLARDRGLRLDRALGDGLTVIGDVGALRRAVDNLLSNAVRLAPTGTTVLLAAGVREGWCWVGVRDDGPGITMTDQERVFDRFWRGTRGAGAGGRADHTDRTGLGLSIVRQIVEGHGGTVALHSAPGVGSTFVLWLPERPAAGRPARRPRPPSGDPLPGRSPARPGD